MFDFDQKYVELLLPVKTKITFILVTTGFITLI